MVINRDGILERQFLSRYLAIILVFSDSSFCLVFYLHFFVLPNAIHELSFLVSQIFCGFLKPEKSMEQKTRVFCQTDFQEFHLSTGSTARTRIQDISDPSIKKGTVKKEATQIIGK